MFTPHSNGIFVLGEKGSMKPVPNLNIATKLTFCPYSTPRNTSNDRIKQFFRLFIAVEINQNNRSSITDFWERDMQFPICAFGCIIMHRSDRRNKKQHGIWVFTMRRCPQPQWGTHLGPTETDQKSREVLPPAGLTFNWWWVGIRYLSSYRFVIKIDVQKRNKFPCWSSFLHRFVCLPFVSSFCVFSVGFLVFDCSIFLFWLFSLNRVAKHGIFTEGPSFYFSFTASLKAVSTDTTHQKLWRSTVFRFLVGERIKVRHRTPDINLIETLIDTDRY